MLDVAVPNGATSMQLRARRILYTCSPPRRRAARAHAPASPAPAVAPASWLSPPRAPPLGALLADERGLVAVEVVEPQTPEHPRLPHAVPPAKALLLPLLEDVARHAHAREAREAVTRHLARRHEAERLG